MCCGMNWRQSWSDQMTGFARQKKNLTTEPLPRMTISTGGRLPLIAANLWIRSRKVRLPLMIQPAIEWIMCHILCRNVLPVDVRHTRPARSHLMASLPTKFLTRGWLVSQPSWQNHTSRRFPVIFRFPLQLSFRKNTKLGHGLLYSPKNLVYIFLL